MKNSQNNSHTTDSVFRLLIDALKGKEHDYTKGSLRTSAILLAIPMVLEMGMESIFAVVDIFFVASLGADAIAVVGLTEALITLIYAVAIGFSMGVTAVIARRIGEGEHELAALSAGQVLLIGCVISLIVATIGFGFSTELLQLMGASEQVIAQGKSYTQLMLGGSITIIYLFIVAAVFRGAGNAFIAMRALWLANAFNIVLDPCFIYGWGPFPELGVTGAAVATNIGRGAGACYLLYHLFKGDTRIQLLIKHLIFSSKESINLIKVSIGGILQFFIATASWVLLMRIVAQFGSEAVASYTIAMRIAMFSFLPAWGLSNATATLVGQNLGANNAQRAEESVWLTAKYNVIFMLSMGLILLLFAQNLVGVFTQEATVLKLATYTLQIIALGYPCYALGMIMTQAFNGAGDTITPTKINFVCFWLFQIPYAWFAANMLGFNSLGAATAVALAESLIALIAWWQFRKGKWKLSKV